MTNIRDANVIRELVHECTDLHQIIGLKVSLVRLLLCMLKWGIWSFVKVGEKRSLHSKAHSGRIKQVTHLYSTSGYSPVEYMISGSTYVKTYIIMNTIKIWWFCEVVGWEVRTWLFYSYLFGGTDRGRREVGWAGEREIGKRQKVRQSTFYLCTMCIENIIIFFTSRSYSSWGLSSILSSRSIKHLHFQPNNWPYIWARNTHSPLTDLLHYRKFLVDNGKPIQPIQDTCGSEEGPRGLGDDSSEQDTEHWH